MPILWVVDKDYSAEEGDDQLDDLAVLLTKKFEDFKKDRAEWEDEWRDAHEQFKRVAKPELDATEGLGGRSKHTYGLTRKKVKILVAHVYDLLFNQGKLPFDLGNTPVPDYEISGGISGDLREVLEDQERVEGMQTLMEDQLVEGKFRNEFHSFLLQLAICGSSAIEGPLVEMKKRTQYLPVEIPQEMMVESEEGGMSPDVILENMEFEISTKEQPAPQFKYRDIWDVYPDMSTEDVHEGEGLFVVDQLTEKELAEMSQQRDAEGKDLYDRKKILAVLNGPDKKFIEDIDLGPHRKKHNESEGEDRKFNVLTWHGSLSKKDAKPFMTDAVESDGDLTLDDYLPVEVIVTFCNGKVFRYAPNTSAKKRRQVKVCPLLRVPGSPFGWGIPRETRDANSVFDSFLRLFIDNKRHAGYVDKIIDRDRITNPDDVASFGREFLVRPGANTDNAVQYILYPDVSQNMLPILEFCEAWGDSASGMPAFLEGADVQTSSQTAYEVSEQKSSAIKMLGIVMHYIDERILVPIFEDLYYWNMQYAEDNTLKGDFEIVAQGYTAFKDTTVRGGEIRNLLAMGANDPELSQELDKRSMVQELTKIASVDIEKFVKTDKQKQQDAERAQQAQAQARQEAMQDAANAQQMAVDAKNQEIGAKHQADMESLMLKQEQSLNELQLKMTSDGDKALLIEETKRLEMMRRNLSEDRATAKKEAPGGN